MAARKLEWFMCLFQSLLMRSRKAAHHGNSGTTVVKSVLSKVPVSPTSVAN